MSDEPKQRYRVRPGYRHGAMDQYGAGDEVELTAAEAAGFLDKLEPVEPVEPDPPLAPAVPKGKEK